jgi:quinolinate synthase
MTAKILPFKLEKDGYATPKSVLEEMLASEDVLNGTSIILTVLPDNTLNFTIASNASINLLELQGFCKIFENFVYEEMWGD